jgi:hypothetical protein
MESNPMATRQPIGIRRLPLALAVAIGFAGCAPTPPPASIPAADPGARTAAGVPTPVQVIGFDPGEDYKLADDAQLRAFYEALAAASDRVRLVEIGRSTQDRPMLLLFISTPENLAQLERWRSISERLGRAEGLTDEDARRLAREGKAIVWIDAGLHSPEVAHAQHAPHLAYQMATDESDESRRIREDVILLLMPMMNPDGHEIVVDWYRRNLGTPYETTLPPYLYHEFVGHDNNRDWFMFRQQETRVVGNVLYHEWFPQIVFNHHQQAPFPARIFIPPFADPVNPHIDPRVVRGVNLVGAHMAKRFEMEGMPGVVARMSFTMWWNGGMRTAPYFHNMIGILSEVGHMSATPQDHDLADFPETFGSASLRIPTLEPSIFYPNPWRGGRASIGQAVQYHLVASLGTLDVAQKNKEDFLYNFYLMGRDAIRAGESGGPFAYVISLEDQHDPGEAVELLNTLRHGGIEVRRATAPFQAGGRSFVEGSYVLYAAQAFRAHLLDMMEPQNHPHREIYPGGPPERPYGGLAGYTLPIQMGIEAVRIDAPFQARTEPVARVPVPRTSISGDGDVLLLSPVENRSFTALHRALAAGARVGRATEAFEVDGRRFAPGTLVVEGSASSTSTMADTAHELGLSVHRTARAPSVSIRPVGPARIGLYRSWIPNADEGWTRWLLGYYGIPYESLSDQDVRTGDLSRFDVILFASQAAQSILRGHRDGTMPAEYTGGVGEEGVSALQRFVRGGGRLVALDNATDFLLEHFDIPVRNTLEGLSPEEFFVPGSLVRLQVDADHPVAFGMQRDAAAFFQGGRAFEVTGGGPQVVVNYGSRDLLLSGWEIGAAEHLTGRAAVVRAPVGQGDRVLIGFRSQFRAQPAGTFKLLFNALQLSAPLARLRAQTSADAMQEDAAGAL